MYVCVFVCVFERWVPQQKKSPVFSPSYSHRAVRLKAYFATCVHVFRTELDRAASSGEVTDCVIVSKLNNQYSSTCWDNAIIHLSIVEDCRQRDISHCCLLFEMPYFRNSLSELCKNKSCLIFLVAIIWEMLKTEQYCVKWRSGVCNRALCAYNIADCGILLTHFTRFTCRHSLIIELIMI